MSSTRLPGKVLMDLAGEPMLARVVERTSRAATVDQVVVATTERDDDDAIVELCDARAWSYFRGSEEDVLDRYFLAAREYDAEAIVRITSDCPLTDPDLTDLVVREFLEHQPGVHYASNGLPNNTYPLGLSVEVVRFDALWRAREVAEDKASREHVTLFVYRHPELFTLHGVCSDRDCSGHRWTVDTREDLEVVRRIYEHFPDDRFTWEQVLALMEAHPEWQETSRHVVQKTP